MSAEGNYRATYTTGDFDIEYWTKTDEVWEKIPDANGRVVRRIIIEEYETQHDTWGSAPRHRCALTDAKPGEVMGYYCPVCNGVTC